MIVPISVTKVFCVFLAAAVLALTGCGHITDTHNGPLLHAAQEIDLDQAKTTRVQIRMGAGELRVRGDSPKLAEADFTYDDPSVKPMMRYNSDSFGGRLTIEQPDHSHFHANRENQWDLRFNNDRPMDLEANLGVGEARMDLGSLNLRSLEIHMGVGELRLDLRGKPKRDYDVTVHGGVGEASVYLPKDVGIEATAAGGIGDIQVHGLEKHNGRWINPAQSDARTTIHLDVKGGVGSITLFAE